MRTLIIGVVVFATLGFVHAKTDEYSDALRIIRRNGRTISTGGQTANRDNRKG
jgi:hypothetical protein